MKYIDYREKLGIGFNQEQIYLAFKNKIEMGLDIISQSIRNSYYQEPNLSLYFITVSEKARYPYSCDIDGVKDNISRSESFNELISKCIVLINLTDGIWISSDYQKFFKNYFFDSLDDLNILYDKTSDDDGVFIFPKGAKELDDALVSQPLEWLKDYPKSHATFVRALKQYSNGDYARDVADNFRKALEEFLQEFLGNGKNLETNKNEICRVLGENGADSNIGSMLQALLNSYKNLNDKVAKHNDKVDAKFLEFLMYQTGLFIRMIITTCDNKEEE